MAFVRKFYIADTHFRHAKIIECCDRPYASTDEMDNELIRRWNAVVGVGDIVYHLGDFAFGLGDEEAIKNVFSRLNGRKVLVLGNHDFRKNGVVHPTIAALDWYQPPTPMLETSDEGQRVILCHYAMRTWPGQHRGAYHFYGHSHGDLLGVGRSRDVGVDMRDVDFTPRTFLELTRGMQ